MCKETEFVLQHLRENDTLSKGLFCIILFVAFPSYRSHENVWLVSDSSVIAAVIEIAKSKEDAFIYSERCSRLFSSG